jgi:hypothetical protein
MGNMMAHLPRSKFTFHKANMALFSSRLGIDNWQLNWSAHQHSSDGLFLLKKLNPLAADYLSFMYCLLPPDSPQVKQQNALGLLKTYSFATGQTDDQPVSLHRLVHLATRN